MDPRRFVIGALVGGVAVMSTGYLLFAMAPLSAFYAHALNTGAGTSVARAQPLAWAVGVGALSYSALVTLAIESRAGASSIGAGIKIGAVVGFLLWLTADFMFYGISHVGNATTAAISPLIDLVPGAIAGGVIAAVLGRIR